MPTDYANEQPVARRPHPVAPALESIRVILAVKNFAAIPGVCHIGLGVTALNTMKVLRRAGVQCEVWAAQTAKELYLKIEADEALPSTRPVTHVVVSAPSWVQPCSFADFSHRWPNIEFVQLNHSGMAYLSIDKFGLRNIRQVLDLSRSLHNVRVAGNNRRFTQWVGAALGTPAVYLPNLYDTSTFAHPVVPRRNYDPLRIGSFGASRPWKNQLVAAEAAVEIARALNVPLELYVNTKRPDGGERMIESRAELFAGLPNAKIVAVPWALWPTFRQTLATMDLMISPSFDETFCVVVADGIAEGCPSVVTAAMEWAPLSWMAAHPFDPGAVARVGLALLHHRIGAIHDGRQHLQHFVNAGLRIWIEFLTAGQG